MPRSVPADPRHPIPSAPSSPARFARRATRSLVVLAVLASLASPGAHAEPAFFQPDLEPASLSLVVPIEVEPGSWNFGRRQRGVVERSEPKGNAPRRRPRIEPATLAAPPAVEPVVEARFFSPSRPLLGGTWGAGPVLRDPFLFEGPGPRRIAPQPHGIALRPVGSPVYGGFANHLFALGGTPSTAYAPGAVAVNPFLSFNLLGATTLTVQTEATDSWLRSRWALPVSGVVSHAMLLGELPIQLGAGARYDPDARDGQGELGVRLVGTMQFP